MRFVLDASVALTWLLKDAGDRSEAYAFEILRQIRSPATEIYVPGVWGLEIASVIARSEAKGDLTEAQSERFLEVLAAAPIVMDAASSTVALSATLQLARRYRLSSYDASYLELALRVGLPLATLDEALKKAATKAGVKIHKAA